MVQVKKFAGTMNTDDPVDVINPFHHIDAHNGRFTGQTGNLRFESIEGTTELTNALLPATGTNTTIGTHFDEIRNRVFFFNYNSLGKNGIYILNFDKTFTKVVETNLSFDDPLAFDASVPISSIDILYNKSPSLSLL